MEQKGTNMTTTRNYWSLRARIAYLTVLVLLGMLSVFQAEAQTARRVVAVYQFNSVIPEISGPLARELFIGALVRSGKFAIAPPNSAGAEYIFDGAVSESKAAKGSMQNVLKDLLAGEQAALSFDVRIVEARSGMLLDYVNVTTREMISKKLRLTDVLDRMKAGNPSAQNRATADLLGPYVTEAVNRIAAKYGPSQASGLTNFPQQGGYAQPGYTNPSDPYQSGYPSTPQGTPGYTQPGYPPGSGYPSQPGYPSTQYPSQMPSGQTYPPGFPSPQSPSAQYPGTQYPPSDPYGYGSQGYGQPGYPSTQYPPGAPGSPGASQPGYPSMQYPGSQYPQDPNQPGYPGAQPGYPSTQYPLGTPGLPGSQPGYPAMQSPFPAFPPGQVQPRGIDATAPPATPDGLLATFDPSQHEVGDARATGGNQLHEGSNLVHTEVTGHTLFAVVEAGKIVGWSATDGQGNPVPLILMGTESSCWECAMRPGLCWKVFCALEDEELGTTPSK